VWFYVSFLDGKVNKITPEFPVKIADFHRGNGETRRRSGMAIYTKNHTPSQILTPTGKHAQNHHIPTSKLIVKVGPGTGRRYNDSDCLSALQQIAIVGKVSCRWACPASAVLKKVGD